jgi:predicted O-methyltransferase YrrM
MSGKSFNNVDPFVKYSVGHSLRLQPIQQELIAATKEAYPQMYGGMGAPEVIQLLGNLLQLIKAKKYIDVGVFTGASSLGAALALPDDGKVVACDIKVECTEIAKKFWKKAGVDHKIDLRIQPAVKTLDDLIAAGESGTYDMVFVDADKGAYDNYYERSLILVRKGGIIAFDNVLRSGRVFDDQFQDTETVAIRAINEKLHHDERVNISFLTTGDGLTLAFKK